MSHPSIHGWITAHTAGVASNATYIGGTIGTGFLSLLAFFGADDPDTAHKAVQGLGTTIALGLFGLAGRWLTLNYEERKDRRATRRDIADARREILDLRGALEAEKKRGKQEREIAAKIQLKQRNLIDGLRGGQRANREGIRDHGLAIREIARATDVKVDPVVPPEGSGDHPVIL